MYKSMPLYGFLPLSSPSVLLAFVSWLCLYMRLGNPGFSEQGKDFASNNDRRFFPPPLTLHYEVLL